MYIPMHGVYSLGRYRPLEAKVEAGSGSHADSPVAVATIQATVLHTYIPALDSYRTLLVISPGWYKSYLNQTAQTLRARMVTGH